MFDEWIIFRESSMLVVLFPFLSNIRSILVTSCAPRKRITKILQRWIKICLYVVGTWYRHLYI